MTERDYSKQQLGEVTGAGVEINTCCVIQTHDGVCVLLTGKRDGMCACAEGYKQTSLGHQTGAEKVI